MSEYGGARWQRFRKQVREDARLRRLACGICRQALDFSLTFPDADAVEVDHIVPASIRPDLFFVRSNVRCVHSRCNKGRGNKPAQEWVRPSW